MNLLYRHTPFTSLNLLGKEQFKTYQESILHSRKIALTTTIKRNKLQIYKDTKIKRKSAMKLKVDNFKQQAGFFGKIFVTLESRDEYLKEFFRHESSSWPPALSCGGLLHTCAKSDLLKCLLDPTTSNFDDEPVSPIVYDFIVFHGGYLIHTLTRKATKGKLSANILRKVLFFSQNSRESGLARRLDIVWDRYNSMSIEESTRDKRGHSCRQRVTG